MKNNYFSRFMALKGIILLAFFSINSNAQNNYSVVSIPYQEYTANLPVQYTQDDTYSIPIPLTFNFDFYGNIYNQVVVSTNGYIDFRTNLATQFSPWSFSSPIPNPGFQTLNSILGCYHDMDNSNVQGTITNSVVGTAPYRKFVVVYYNNSHFSCTALKSSLQMILYETSNIIDVQIISKDICLGWNAGNAVTGIINATGAIALTPPGRNTGQWTAFHEAWRFSRPVPNKYFYTKCDDSTIDGLTNFDLLVAQTDLSPGNPSAISFYESMSDAQSQINAISSLNYTNNTASLQSIYASDNVQIKEVELRVVDCSVDYDGDTVATTSEDTNNDGNLANDDTDADGIPDFTDNDDDGDLVLTNEEYVFVAPLVSQNVTLLQDTDNDGTPDYLDKDDDGDGVWTINEDYNANHNPMDDDTNANEIPDYLDNAVALSTSGFHAATDIKLYPNPTNDILNIDNGTGELISEISVYSINGSLVKEQKMTAALSSISVSDLPNGIYFMKLVVSSQVFNYKFVKK